MKVLILISLGFIPQCLHRIASVFYQERTDCSRRVVTIVDKERNTIVMGGEGPAGEAKVWLKYRLSILIKRHCEMHLLMPRVLASR